MTPGTYGHFFSVFYFSNKNLGVICKIWVGCKYQGRGSKAVPTYPGACHMYSAVGPIITVCVIQEFLIKQIVFEYAFLHVLHHPHPLIC